MADVELVIRIDKIDYRAIKNKKVIGDLTIPNVFNAIRNGTPLKDRTGTLDKIRAEIDNINLNEVASKYEDRFYGFQQEVIKILDKYKESEEE